jgi:hypothetical protein
MQLKRLAPTRNGNHVGDALSKHPADAEDAPLTALEERQRLLAHMVRLVARGVSTGLFIYGVGGCGKSLTVSKTLAEEGVCPVLVNSHITPLALYMALFHNRTGKVIWMEDVDGIYGNMAVLGLLRSALWGTDGQRIVTYTSTQLEGLPNQFVFSSRMIFCANAVPKRNEGFRAVLSRIDVFELTASNEDILQHMRVLAAKGYSGLSPRQCLDIVAFLEKAGGTRRLSMRLFEPSLKKVEYALQNGIDWRDLVRSQLDQIGQGEGVPRPLDTKAYDLKCLALAVERYPASVKMQEDFWCEATGKSRATFFRVKREFEKQRDNDVPVRNSDLL